MIIRFSISFAFLFFGVFSVEACSCIRTETYSMLEEFKSTDLVFIGRVIEIDTVTIPDSIFDFAVDELWYTFEVTLLYRGKWKQKTIRVQSGFTNADDCKYVFKMGQEYVVYANHPLRDNKRKNKSVFETTVCTNTDKATDFKIVESEGLRRS